MMLKLRQLFVAGLLSVVARAGELDIPVVPTLHSLACPAGADSGESSLVTAPDGTLVLTWAEPAGGEAGSRALRFATLAPGASQWSEAGTIVTTPLLMENWADFASVAISAGGTWTAQWFQRHADPESRGYDGWMARSSDRGKTWSPAVPLGHEFVALASLPGERTLAVWLESTRIKNPDTPKPTRVPGAPRPTRDPSAPYSPSMKLSARLLGAEGQTVADWVVDPDVCTCCHNTAAALPGGRAIIAYRGHTPDEVRDIHYAIFDGTHWKEPRLLHSDEWKIPACPVNGPALDTRGDQVMVTWFTMAQGKARVQAKISKNAGEHFGPAIAVDLGRPIGRLDLVTLNDGSSVLSWLEASTDSRAAGLYVRRLFPDGTLSGVRRVASLSAVRASGFPRLAVRPGSDYHVVVTWTEAIPENADPKAPAATRILTAEFSARNLAKGPIASQPSAPSVQAMTAVVRNGDIAFVEWCSTH